MNDSPTVGGTSHVLVSALLMAVGVVGFVNGVDTLDFTWLLLGGAYLAAGPQGESMNLREFFTNTRGVISFVLLVGAIILMAIEIVST